MLFVTWMNDTGNIVYKLQATQAWRIGVQLFWLVLSNIILTLNKNFGLQFGGHSALVRHHEVLSYL